MNRLPLTAKRLFCSKCSEDFGLLPEPRGLFGVLGFAAHVMICALAHVQESERGCKPLDMRSECFHGVQGECPACERMAVRALPPMDGR